VGPVRRVNGFSITPANFFLGTPISLDSACGVRALCLHQPWRNTMKMLPLLLIALILGLVPMTRNALAEATYLESLVP
jgi:hypothetical protein